MNFWELGDEIGDGKLYPTVDDAIDSLTGYNLKWPRPTSIPLMIPPSPRA